MKLMQTARHSLVLFGGSFLFVFSAVVFLLSAPDLAAEQNSHLDSERSFSHARAASVAVRRARAKAKRQKLPVVRSITLLSGETGRAIRGFKRIRKSMSVPMSDLPTTDLLIRPNYNRRRTGSLDIEINGQAAEEESAFRGKKNRILGRWSAEHGDNNISITPYKGKDKDGTQGRTLDIGVELTGDSGGGPNPTPTSSNPNPTPTPPPGPSADGWSLHDAVIYKKGEPFFPFGIYYTSFYNNQKGKRLNDIPIIAGAGLNLIHTPIDLNDRPVLDLCNSLGIEVAVEFNAGEDSVLAEFGNHPAVAWLGTFDDVDAYNSSNQPRHPVNQVRNRSAELKAKVPHTLTYSSGGWPNRISNYLGTTDLLAQQSYPVPFEEVYAVTNGYYRNLADNAPKAGQRFIANLQTFGWGGNNRLPTRRELRNMTYQSLILGVHGIVYYTFFDAVTDLRGNTPILTELALMSEEIKVLKDALLFGERREISTGRGDTFAGEWVYGNTLYVVAINGHRSNSRSISVSLNSNVSGAGPLQNLFNGRESGLSLSGRVLSGTLSPHNVHVYTVPLN